jgi:hypothetical protein
MKPDEIIEMAKQAGINYREISDEFATGNGDGVEIEQMVAFAKLIAAKEREACAKVCEKHADVYGAFEQTPKIQSAWAACIDIRDAIRARGEA